MEILLDFAEASQRVRILAYGHGAFRGVWSALMPETLITVTWVIYQEYIKKRWLGLSLTEFSLAQSEWGAGNESVSVLRGNPLLNSTVHYMYAKRLPNTARTDFSHHRNPWKESYSRGLYYLGPAAGFMRAPVQIYRENSS